MRIWIFFGFSVFTVSAVFHICFCIQFASVPSDPLTLKLLLSLPQPKSRVIRLRLLKPLLRQLEPDSLLHTSFDVLNLLFLPNRQATNSPCSTAPSEAN